MHAACLLVASLLTAIGPSPAVTPSRQPIHTAPLQSDAEVSLEGVLEVLIEDSAAGARRVYILTVGDRRVQLRFASNPPSLQTGTRVRVKGRWQSSDVLNVSTIDRI